MKRNIWSKIILAVCIAAILTPSVGIEISAEDMPKLWSSKALPECFDGGFFGNQEVSDEKEISNEQEEKIKEATAKEQKESTTTKQNEIQNETHYELRTLEIKKIPEKETEEATVVLDNLTIKEITPAQETVSNAVSTEEPKNESKVEDENVFYIAEDGTKYQIAETMEVLATAYCHCSYCCGKVPEEANYGVTASGVNLLQLIESGVTPHVIAADVTVLPLGTKVYIEVPEGERSSYVTEDYGFASVEDTGSAIVNKKIDVYFPTHQEALEWGVKNVALYVLVPIA